FLGTRLYYPRIAILLSVKITHPKMKIIIPIFSFIFSNRHNGNRFFPHRLVKQCPVKEDSNVSYVVIFYLVA
ncbi:MAG: hypothetical protein QN721_00660, partial [Nitrososphaeraceae archaeon]|nr:hypothetical protein [Nitrososphaeraceae archaeon]